MTPRSGHGGTIRATRSPLVLVASVAIAAAGCSASATGDPGSPSQKETGTAEPLCTTADSSPASPGSAKAQVTNVRVGNHDGFDTVVFDVTSATRPGYRAIYASLPVLDGQGRELPLGGKEAIVLSISPPDETGGGATLEGAPTDLKQNYRGLQEVRSARGADGFVTYGVGVSGKDGFRVQLHKDSSTKYRLQVDVAHAGARPWSDCGR